MPVQNQIGYNQKKVRLPNTKCEWFSHFLSACRLSVEIDEFDDRDAKLQWHDMSINANQSFGLTERKPENWDSSHETWNNHSFCDQSRYLEKADKTKTLIHVDI